MKSPITEVIKKAKVGTRNRYVDTLITGIIAQSYATSNTITWTETRKNYENMHHLMRKHTKCVQQMKKCNEMGAEKRQAKIKSYIEKNLH